MMASLARFATFTKPRPNGFVPLRGRGKLGKSLPCSHVGFPSRDGSNRPSASLTGARSQLSLRCYPTSGHPAQRTPRIDEICLARSRRASKDARLSTGYGDAAIQGPRGALRPPGLLRFARNDENHALTVYAPDARAPPDPDRPVSGPSDCEAGSRRRCSPGSPARSTPQTSTRVLSPRAPLRRT
jgi:hypothetical protein